MRSRRPGLSAGLVVALLVAGAISWLPTTAASAQTATSVSFVVTPASPVNELTAVTFHVTVKPAEATGTVAITANGEQIASGIATGGKVDLVLPGLKPGSQSVQATFYPADAVAWSSSASETQVVQVIAQGYISMTVVKGNAVSPGGPVKIGSTVRVAVWGFPASSDVTLVLDSTGMTTVLSTDTGGAGTALIYLPRSLASRVYRLTATSGRVSTAFAFYVYNPDQTASPTPSPTATTTAGVPVTVVPVTNVGIPATGHTPELAHTGTDVADVLPLAALFIALGAFMVMWSRGPVVVEPLGRHSVRTAPRPRPKHAR